MNPVVRPTTIDSVAFEAAELYAERIAVACGSAAVTFDELTQKAARFARWLMGVGLEAGERVALWLPNGVPWVIAEIAIAAAGGTCVPISTRLTPREVRYILNDCGARVTVAAHEFLNRRYADEVRELMPSSEVVELDPQVGELPSGGSAGELRGSKHSDPAMVIYTSGTTGEPKGCLLSHECWTNNARLSAERALLAGNDTVFAPSPFFHLFGSLTGLMGAMSVGATFVTSPRFDAASAIDAIREWQVSHVVAVPTMWLDIKGRVQPGELRSLRGGVWGGGPFPGSELEDAISRYSWDLQAIYGMTEAPTLSQVSPSDPRWAKLETVGQATLGVELQILDADSHVELPPLAVGEIHARGYNRMAGYLGRPDDTAARFRGEWINTGDLGMLDDAGFLRIVGRSTDMIVSGGANIYAKEVEDVLQEAPGVELAAVVAAADHRLGEVVVAWLQPMRGYRLKTAVVLSHCKENLAGYKVPRRIFVVDQLPLTAGGKIHKAVLSENTAAAIKENV